MKKAWTLKWMEVEKSQELEKVTQKIQVLSVHVWFITQKDFFHSKVISGVDLTSRWTSFFQVIKITVTVSLEFHKVSVDLSLNNAKVASLGKFCPWHLSEAYWNILGKLFFRVKAIRFKLEGYREITIKIGLEAWKA